jgi:preprotein translocase subunit SecA
MSVENVLGYVNKIIRRVFGSYNDRLVASMIPIVDQISALEPAMRKLKDGELTKKTAEFRNRLADGAPLDDLLVEAFAVCREASRRAVLSRDLENPVPMRHFDVQLIGGIVLHRGMIAEMVTGEGKTLVATLAAYLNALEGKGVHIVTVNDYLAQRDRDWMGPMFELLGMTGGAIQHDQDYADKQAAYRCDVTWGTDHEFGFDYLRDNMRHSVEEQVMRGRHFAIVDECDSVLIDEARTPLIISGPAEESTDKYYIADKVARRLAKDKHFEVKEKEHQVHLSEGGIEAVEKALGVDSIYTGKNIDWPHHIEQALRAHHLYKRDQEYIVKGGEVVIVDEFTGRLMPGRVWSDGLHQAVAAKEFLRIKEENQTLATITYQNFFRLYKKLAGMTGTALTEAAEFKKIYNLDVVVIPTNKPLIRNASPDVVYRTAEEKWDALVDEIIKTHEIGRPVLVGTRSIEKNEMLSDMLKRRGIKHEVLNAKHHEREAQIIAKAGQPAAVTIATNMAGRGTDIVLGPGVAEKGGLHIVGTERHEARRIDNQLRGRAGRQGDPGTSRFFLSLEDDLMRIFASERVSAILKKLGMEKGMAIEHGMVTRSIERAQRKMEERNFDIRKNLLEYDEVMDEQRKIIYGQRQEILEGGDTKQMVYDMLKEVVQDAVDEHLPPKVNPSEWNITGLCAWVRKKAGVEITPDEFAGKPVEEIENQLVERLKDAYEEREKVITAEHPDMMRRIERFLLLDRIDTKWKEHLYAMDHLKSGIGLRGYAQVDPKVEYKREGYAMFDDVIRSVKQEVTDYIFKVRVETEDEKRLAKRWSATMAEHPTAAQQDAQMATSAGEGPVRPIVKKTQGVGRNDPCPCGSGKKYKRCCGQAA